MSDRFNRVLLPKRRDSGRCAIEGTATLAFALILCSSLLPAIAWTEAAPAGDLDVKANFVLNFIRLVNWSSIPGEQNNRELVVCAFSSNDFFVAFRNVARGKTVGNRPIVCKIETIPDSERCRVLLVDRAQYRPARQILGAIKDAPILTVGNGPGFLDAGGMFELIVEQGKVQFDVGLEAIRLSGLDVSGRLLHLARSVRPGDTHAF